MTKTSSRGGNTFDIWNAWSLQLTKGSFVEVGGGLKYKEEVNIAMLYT
jgi:hypothetical protein